MEELPKVNSVRAMIHFYEDNCRNETAQRLNRTMSRSFAGLSFTERKYKTNSSNDNDIIYHLDQRLTSLSLKLRDYKIYAKEIHIAFQEELIEIITILINTDTKNNTLLYRKKELMYDIKARFNELGAKLPSSFSNNGFGDSSYKPFSWKRPNSIAGVGPNRNITETVEIWKNNVPQPPKSVKPQRTQSVTDRYVNSFQQLSRNGSELPGRDLKIAGRDITDVERKERNSIKESPKSLIGGAAGIRRSVNSSNFERTRSENNSLESPDIIIGGAAGVRRSDNSSDFDTVGCSVSSNEGVVYESLSSPSSLRKSPEFIIGGAAGVRRSINVDTTRTTIPAKSDDYVQLRAKNLQRSSSVMSQDEAINGLETIGNSKSSTNWTYAEMSGRRRPISLGGTIVTLNSPESIISSMKFSREFSQSSEPRDAEDGINDVTITEIQETNDGVEDENNLQSVNTLKRLFEFKSDEEREEQNSLNAKEDQRGEFVQSLNKSIELLEDQNGRLIREDSVASSNNTIVEDQNGPLIREDSVGSTNNTTVEVEVEENEFGGSKRVIVTKTSSFQEMEGLNNPVLHHKEVKKIEEVIITRSVSEDIEEEGSFCSESSIYLDVD